MFVWRHDGELWVTLQTDHMTQTGEIARAWGNAEFPGPRRPGAILAARLHDEGWAFVDVDPEFDASTGLPVELTGKVFGSVFGSTTMPAAHYRNGVDLLLRIDPYAALIASLHGTGVYFRDYGLDGQAIPDRSTIDAAARPFVDAEEQLQQRLRIETGASDDDVWYDFRLLIAWNRLSQILSRGVGEANLSKVPTGADPAGVTVRARRLDVLSVALDPWPFAAPVELFPVKTYRLEDRRYTSAAEFVETIARTPCFSAVYRVEPER